jgi:membrane-associated phospholipid phosphatase
MRALLWTTAIFGVLTLVCALTLDEPFARWIASHETHPSFWNEAIAYLEYPLGIEPYKWTGVWILCIGSIGSLLFWRKQAHGWLLVTLVHLLGRNVMFWTKYLTGRLRPSEWLEAGGGGTWLRDGWSFPSGHVILFASIAIPVAVSYPRARPLLVVVAFAGCARLAVNAHFLSDVFGGVAVTTAITWLCALPSPTRPPSLR